MAFNERFFVGPASRYCHLDERGVEPEIDPEDPEGRTKPGCLYLHKSGDANSALERPAREADKTASARAWRRYQDELSAAAEAAKAAKAKRRSRATKNEANEGGNDGATA